MPDRSGEVIDKYRLIRLLGEGGFGEVYLAEDKSNGTHVAVKIFLRGPSNFINEARAAFHLDHPNIVRLKDFGLEKRIPFLVMDYMHNGTLRHRHPRNSRLPLESIVSYVKQISAALQYLHDQGKVHRDVKPENILIGPNNETLLSDFGIATTSYTVDPVSQAPAGSFPYMAPEQIHGEAVRASDQYALGAIVYEWLTGDPPFEGTPDELIRKHLNIAPLPLRKKEPTTSPEVEKVVMRALAKDRHQRFASISEFATALEQASRLQPLIFREHTAGLRTVAWSSAGKYIASAGNDETVRVWEAATGTPIFAHQSHVGEVWSIAWSPNSQYIASAGDDGTVQIWEVTKVNSVFTYRNHLGAVHAVAWSPDGKYIASASDDRTVQIWHAVTQTPLYLYNNHTSSVEAVAWSPNGTLIVSGSDDNTVQVWQATTGKHHSSYNNHADRVTAVAWSPDGTLIASGSYDNTVHVWEATTGSCLSIYRYHSDPVSSVAWSPGGKHIASASWDNTAQVWEAATGKRLYTYRDHTSWVNAVAWSPDGKYVASASWDSTVQVWPVP